MRVFMENNNSGVWNFEKKIIDIIHALKSDQEVIIDLNTEGPCCEHIGIFDILDYICEKFLFSQNSIVIETCNMLEKHDCYNIKKIYDLIDLNEIKKLSIQNSKKNFDSEKFKVFGNFVGRATWVRLWISSLLWKTHSNNLIKTFHWNNISDFHLTHIDLDNMIRFGASLDEIKIAIDFLSNAPYELDQVNKFPILSDNYSNIIEWYKYFFVDVVCETYFSGNTFFPTEKTWRSIATKTPFIIHGPVDFLRNLRKLGFKTFDEWWDESYDDYSHEERIEKILELTDEIAKYSTDELYDMYEDMSEVLEHNCKVFNELSEDDFQRVFK